MIDMTGEAGRREALMHALAEEFATRAVLTTSVLAGFDFGFGAQRLMDPRRGIWNPTSFVATLTIISDPDNDYGDGPIGDSQYRYAYQAIKSGDPLGGVNRKLRRAMELGLPVVMLRKIMDGKYVPVMPVYVIEDDQENRFFTLALDESLRFLPASGLDEDQRRYADQTVKRRLHQPEFRARVLEAYSNKCAVCVLQKVPLLDAAHIVGDAEDDGLPIVSNGLSLCKIHHAAYDQNFLGISPDYRVHINADLMLEVDGPMLKHGIQEMNDRSLWVPSRRNAQPNTDRLAARFEEFRRAG